MIVTPDTSAVSNDAEYSAYTSEINDIFQHFHIESSTFISYSCHFAVVLSSNCSLGDLKSHPKLYTAVVYILYIHFH